MGSSQQYYNRYERPQAERDLPPPIRVIEERIEIRDGREFRVTVLS